MIRTIRVVVPGLALLLLLAVASSGAQSSGATIRAAACANDQTALAKLSARQVRGAFVCLINVERTRFGLPPLQQNRKLTTAAQGYANDMVKRDYFSHDAPAPNRSTPIQRITRAGYKWAAWGESIAAGYPTPLATMTAWMGDTGHCQNVLLPLFADIGVGYVNKPLPSHASSPAVWTAEFGLQLGTKQPSQNSQPAQSCPHGF